MQVFTFAATDPNAPVKAIARIWHGKAKPGAALSGWHPVDIFGATPELAEAAARTWWAEQLAKQAPKPKRTPKAETPADFDVI